MRCRVCWLLALLSIGFAQNWEVQRIAVGGPCSIAADSACSPRVAFSCPTGLGYASRAGDSWVVSHPHAGIAVPAVRLCLDTNWLPHIAYQAGPYDPPYTDSICYAYSDGDSWHIEVVARNADATLYSLALGRYATPHVLFVDSGVVKYAHKSGDTWSVVSVPATQTDTLRLFGSASLALDAGDRPGVAVSWWKSGVPRDSLWLSVFEYDGQDWQRQDVDSTEGWAPWDFWPVRVRYDPASDLFHVVYRAYRYAVGKGEDWQVDWTGSMAGNVFCDFVLHQGRPHIASASPRDPLTYQWRSAGEWEQELVVDEAAPNVSIAVDHDGRPHVAFAPAGGETLFYARRLFIGVGEPPARVQAETRFSICPNPALRAFSVEFTASRRTTISITITDASGRTVLSQEASVDAGHSRYRIALPASVRPGVYFCTFDDGRRRTSRKVVLTS